MSDTFNFKKGKEDTVTSFPKPDGTEGPKIPGLQLISKKDETSSAIVWSALQLSLDREVVVWVMKEELAHKTTQVEHFETVSRAVSRIRHPNLVQIIDVARTPKGTPYVVFEDVEGTSLASLLRTERKLDPMRALRIGIEIADALDFAWKQCGFIHRNIKPETIILGTGDAIKLTNFSTATLAKPGQNALAYDEGLVVGTPNYASPEQIDCLRTIDYHSDMYSTGALLYRMITGITPFGGEADPMVVFDLQRAGTLENPRDLDTKINPDVVHIIQKMMAKAPEDRYTWWQDAIEDMHRVLDGRPPYRKSGNDVLPPSTVALPLTDEESSGKQSPRSFKVQKKVTRLASDQIRSSSTTANLPSKRSSGPSTFLKMGVVFLLIGFCFWLISVRLDILEDARIKDASQETMTPSDDRGASSESDGSQGSAVSERQDLIADSAESFDSGDDENVSSATLLGEGSQMKSTEDAWADATVENNETDTAVLVLSQTELIKKLYRNVLDYPLSEARERASVLFKKSKQTSGLNEEQNKLIWRAFSEACSYEDLVGFFLAGSPGKRTLTVDGEELEITPRMYSNGELICILHLQDGTYQTGHCIQLSDMTDAEKYDCLQASVVDTDQAALFARAFLTMKMNDRGAFSLFIKKYNLKELEPFLDYIGK